MYIPRPTETNHITLPEELTPLQERLAANVHQVWMDTRLSQGWSYGDRRDDVNKKHPGLVPYDRLPETEKEFDRTTAMGTLKLILALGYHFEKSETPRQEFPPELIGLREQIAEDIHELWAKGRLEQGWSYGDRRDDVHKKHPSLVPYDQLEEAEKEYDRKTAFETLSLILSLGYEIQK